MFSDATIPQIPQALPAAGASFQGWRKLPEAAGQRVPALTPQEPSAFVLEMLLGNPNTVEVDPGSWA